MMPGENEIRENLTDAGLSISEAEPILECIRTGDIKGAERLIGMSRKNQLDALHRSQRCIDCLDYLVYQMGK